MQVEYLYDKIKLFCLIPVALGKKKSTYMGCSSFSLVQTEVRPYFLALYLPCYLQHHAVHPHFALLVPLQPSVWCMSRDDPAETEKQNIFHLPQLDCTTSYMYTSVTNS